VQVELVPALGAVLDLDLGHLREHRLGSGGEAELVELLHDFRRVLGRVAVRLLPLPQDEVGRLEVNHLDQALTLGHQEGVRDAETTEQLTLLAQDANGHDRSSSITHATRHAPFGIAHLS